MAEVERLHGAASVAEPYALRLGRVFVDGVPVEHDAVVPERDLGGDEVAEHVAEDELRVALERVAPAACPRCAEDEPVIRRDGDLVDLGRELDAPRRRRGSGSSCSPLRGGRR